MLQCFFVINIVPLNYTIKLRTRVTQKKKEIKLIVSIKK